MKSCAPPVAMPALVEVLVQTPVADPLATPALGSDPLAARALVEVSLEYLLATPTLETVPVATPAVEEVPAVAAVETSQDEAPEDEAAAERLQALEPEHIFVLEAEHGAAAEEVDEEDDEDERQEEVQTPTTTPKRKAPLLPLPPVFAPPIIDETATLPPGALGSPSTAPSDYAPGTVDGKRNFEIASEVSAAITSPMVAAAAAAEGSASPARLPEAASAAAVAFGAISVGDLGCRASSDWESSGREDGKETGSGSGGRSGGRWVSSEDDRSAQSASAGGSSESPPSPSVAVDSGNSFGDDGSDRAAEFPRPMPAFEASSTERPPLSTVRARQLCDMSHRQRAPIRKSMQ
jgi:hypothetical protein